MVSTEQIEAWLSAREDEHVELKEAKATFSKDDLARYCIALANERGGTLVLGITPRQPRTVVGSRAFIDLPETVHRLLQRIHLRIQASAATYDGKRVVVFEVPSRPIGVPLEDGGTYWMRAGESLTGMTPDMLQRIFAEATPDFSAQVCPGLQVEDLDTQAIEDFRRRWMIKAKIPSIGERPVPQLLHDIEALTEGGLTYAALVLFGTRAALRKHLAQAEVVFEYRSSEAPGPAQQRKEYQSAFFSYYEDIWATINLRNDVQHYQDGLFILDIPTFDERSVREAVLNAVSHRDYRHGGNVFIRQLPRQIVIESPGGFPTGIGPDNIVDRQNPRNRRIADIFAKCGLVERAGQGMDFMFLQAIKSGKLPPDFSGTDAYQVTLTLAGQVLDPAFIKFLEHVGQKRGVFFSTHDLIALDNIHREQTVPSVLATRVTNLLEKGVIERVGRGKLVLSRAFYTYLGKPGVYTRKRGLDHETNKALLYKHLTDNQATGAKLRELRQVLPSLSRSQVQGLLRDLAVEGRAHWHGNTRSAVWYPGPQGTDCLHQESKKR